MAGFLKQLLIGAFCLVLSKVLESLATAPLVAALEDRINLKTYIPMEISIILLLLFAVGVLQIAIQSLQKGRILGFEDSTSSSDFLPLTVGVFLLSFLWFDIIPYQPLVLVVGMVLLLVGAFFPPLREYFEKWIQTRRDERQGAAQEARIRRALIDKVMEEIHGRLGSMLAAGKSSVIVPIIERQPARVRPPWKDYVNDFDLPDAVLPTGTRIIDLFDQADTSRKLLLLGGPGSGKTTLLLGLARDLVDRARKQRREPVPVIVDLRSWGTQERDFKRWLIQELDAKYAIRKDVSTKLLENGEILPMLDGLDEVGFDKQTNCIQEINLFQLRSFVKGLLVNCRADEYNHCEVRLQLNAAIFVRPFTEGMISEYLISNGHEQLWRNIEGDRDLLDLAATPLFLRMLSQTFAKLSPEQRSRLVERRSTFYYLFGSYVAQMLSRKKQLSLEGPQPEQTQRWLAWLARTLCEHASTDFHIEDIQPTWLTSTTERRIYSTAVATFTGATIGVAASMIVGVNEGIQTGLVTGFVWAMGVGAFVKARTDVRHRIRPIETVRWSAGKLGQGLRIGLLTGFAVGASLTMFHYFFLWVWNLAAGDPTAFPRWLVPVVRWTEPLVIWLLIGLFRILPNLEEIPSLFYLFVSIIDLLSPIIVCGLIGAAVGALVAGLTGPEIATKSIPNQGIRESAYNSVKFAVAGSVLGMAIILAADSLSGYTEQTKYDMIMGATVGAIASAFVPALACIQHYAIRLILFMRGKAPWNYEKFLTYCRESMLLQQVGGRFAFLHVLLQAYFMELQVDEADPKSSPAGRGSLPVGFVAQQERGDYP